MRQPGLDLLEFIQRVNGQSLSTHASRNGRYSNGSICLSREVPVSEDRAILQCSHPQTRLQVDSWQSPSGPHLFGNPVAEIHVRPVREAGLQQW
jgi:hypothetical protein